MELRCFTVLISLISFVGAGTYYMDSPTACGRKISVAEDNIIVEPRGVVGVPNPPIDCRISFESSYSSNNYRFEVFLERFRFNDCGMRLRLFDGLSVGGAYIKELGCSSTGISGSLFSKDGAITIQLTRTVTVYSYANDFSLRLSVYKACNRELCVNCDKDGNCIDCNSSRYGDQCEIDCPDKCAVCVNDQNCTACDPGYSGLTCKDPCKSKLCVHCDKDGNCIECTSGLKGITCEDQCDEKCETCEAVGDKCTLCRDGYYLDKGRGMCLPCLKQCMKCTGRDECTSCNDGFYGNRCHACPSNCETCINHEQCLTCKNGFYTSSCLKNCTDNCSNCTLDDGRCLQCTNRHFGPFCESECGNCAGDLCGIQTGECPGECVDGYYRTHCDTTCSSNCDQSKCEKLSGNCSSCPIGLFGSLCESKCNDDCDCSCDQYTGECKNHTRFTQANRAFSTCVYHVIFVYSSIIVYVVF